MLSTPIEQACALIKNDEVVGMPTETVYGLAGNAFSEKALATIFEVKGRPNSDPLILHVPLNWNTVSALTEKNLIDLSSFSKVAVRNTTRLIERFWPGPLTLVLPKTNFVPSLATSGLPTVALRMPNHPVAQALLQALQLPLAAPSANRFGRISPTSAAHVLEELGNKISLVIDGGPCAIGVESTVVRVSADGAVKVLRPGGISKEQLQHALETEIEVAAPALLHQALNFESPGLLLNHYAPIKPLHLFKPATVAETVSRTKHSAVCIGVLWNSTASKNKMLSDLQTSMPGVEILSWILSPTANLQESAQKLFESLRAMDASNAQVLFAQTLGTTEGIALAIEDRLFKASTKHTAYKP